MAREFVVLLDGKESRFGLTSLNRTKLYGRKKRMVVDNDEQPCSTAYLTRDGAALIPTGGMANLYVNEGNDVTERKHLQAVDEEGEPLTYVNSTLDAPQELEGPVEAQRLLDHLCTAVYLLDPSELGEELSESLEQGDIYETRFSYRGGFEDHTCFLLKNSEGFFALLGRPSGFDWVRRAEVSEEDEEETDPFDDDLDFSMF